MKKYIMALDAGTTSNRCIIFDKNQNIISSSQKEFNQIFPKPGYVEHDGIEILDTMLYVTYDALSKSNISPDEIAAIGITNQRETTVIWNKHTGKPIYNAIVWQCRRTSKYCDELKNDGLTDLIKSKTGLIIDAYFSATKIKWILDNVDGARQMADNGELLFGTVDTWLIWNLTNSKVHATDYSNASRTMLYNIKELKWDDEILELMNIPKSLLPKVYPSSYVYGNTSKEILGYEIPICGVAGDQQSALFGQACFESGDVKNTYGTGCFMLMNTGKSPIISNNGLVTTIAWGINDEIYYALEGSVYIAGAAIKWLREELQIIENSSQTEEYALKVDDTNGCYVVPAFTGLGAPYWDQYARGAILGLTRGTNKYHIIRATLDSLCYQTHDVLEAMQKDSNIKFTSLKVDGGASANNYILQTQANIINTDVIRPTCIETTACGVAYLAGLAVGYYKNLDEIKSNINISQTFSPQINEIKRAEMLNGWKNAVSQIRTK